MSPLNLNTAWTIAGSDPSCGAGIQADLLIFRALGVQGCTIITGLTAQNPQQITAVRAVDSALLQLQINALQNHLPPRAIKLGMLGTASNVCVIADYLSSRASSRASSRIAPVIVDPVMQASAGGDLLEPAGIAVLREKILSHTDLLTPNIFEAEILVNHAIKNSHDIKTAATELLSMGVKAVYLKGGHFNMNSLCASDYFSDGNHSFWVHSPRLQNRHGTGCVLSAAITAAIALGYELKDAIVIGKMVLNQTLRQRCLPAGWPSDQSDLPWITDEYTDLRYPAFTACDEKPLGFYPIVDSVAWVKQLCEWGVKTLQLRIKHSISENELTQIIKNSIAIARYYQTRLFINDYWQLAIQLGADGVHLGQEDLKTVDWQAIQQAGLRLGISTHSFYEIARAHTYQPSYLAFGPIYETTSKAMAFSPRGLPALKYWCELLQYPLVAIGGINLARLSDVLETGVNNVAVISAVTQATNPKEAVQAFQLAIS